MLWVLAIALLALWGLGLVTSATMGGIVHGLIAIAVIVLLFRAYRRRRAG